MRTDFSRCTFVFSVTDHAAFEAEWNRLHKMSSDDKDRPFRVTAMSVDDEIYRSELYYDAVERYSSADEIRHACEAIFQCTDLTEWSWDKYEAETV